MKTIINLNERFTEHFVLSEFLASRKAEEQRIPNRLLARMAPN